MSHKKHILVVEDDLTSQKLLDRMLSRQGFQVTLVDNAQDAMNTTQEEAIHLAVVDVRLNESSGMEYLRWARQQYPRIPVIMLTTIEETTPLAREAKELGAYAYYSKPPDFKEFVEMIKKALNSSSS